MNTIDNPTLEIDGRSARGQENRRRIVAAMLTLVGNDNLVPSAEEVATEANVGLRTVFRHFDDMDSLFREMSTAKRAELQPIIDKPLEGATWRDRLESLVERRAVVFEEMLPYKNSADTRRYASAFLQQEHARQVKQQRRTLGELLPPLIAHEAPLLEAFDLVLSFETWRRLRSDQHLSIAQARRTVNLLVRALIAEAKGPT